MKVLPVLMIIVLGIGCNQKDWYADESRPYKLSKKEITLIFTLGYGKGYNAALSNIVAGKYGLTWADSPTMRQQRTVDSTEFVKMFFK